MRFVPRAFDLVVAALLIAPLVFSGLSAVALFDGNATRVLAAAGSITGGLGLAMLLVAAMLCVRLPVLDRWMGGLPRIWAIHRMLGFGAFILILLHVVLMAFGALPLSVDAAISVLFPPPSSYVIWAGWLALVLMVMFLAPTFQFFGAMDYQRWKRLHLLSAPATILALIHVLPLARSSLVWWLLGVLALGAIVWRKLVAPHAARYAYTVERVDALTPDVVEISLLPVAQPLAHEAGQFVYLTPEDPALSAGRGEEHPFTISSAPGARALSLGIKDLGDASHALQTVTPGSRVWLEGPYGQFFERRAPQCGQLWIGGGIGITPFVGAARDLASGDTAMSLPVSLFYLANRPERAYYTDELQRIAENVAGFDLVAHYFSREGPMTPSFLQAHCPDFAEREIYVCGPPAMIHHVLEVLHASGVSSSLIHTEAFDFL